MAENERKIYRIEDIAVELGVSKTTVSRAISGKGRISEQTRERVRQFISAHDCQTNLLARGLAQRRTFNVALAMQEKFGVGDLPFFQKCIDGICQAAAQNDYDVIVFRIAGTDLSQLKRIIGGRKADGVILTRTMVDDYPARLLKESGVPFVVIGSSEDRDVTHADNDHAGACRTLMNLLLDRGLRSFALIGGSMAYYVNRNRFRGCQAALEEAPERVSCRTYLDVLGEPQLVRAVDDAVEAGADCIVSTDDYLCSRVIARLAGRGTRIPEDISVATCYSSMLLEHSTLTVTGLEFDATKLGAVACQMLIDKLAGRPAADYMSTDYRLLVGNSTK